MKPVTLSRLEAAHLCGLRVIVTSRQGKVLARMPFANLGLAYGAAKAHSWDGPAFVAHDGNQLACIVDGTEIEGAATLPLLKKAA